jgi:hypothetical protein
MVLSSVVGRRDNLAVVSPLGPSVLVGDDSGPGYGARLKLHPQLRGHGS